jgi:hypothetical protein
LAVIGFTRHYDPIGVALLVLDDYRAAVVLDLEPIRVDVLHRVVCGKPIRRHGHPRCHIARDDIRVRE